MFDKVLSWPDSIDQSNWRSIDPKDIFQKEVIGDVPPLENFSLLLSFIKSGLEASEDKKVFDTWGFQNSHDTLISIWVQLLVSLKQTVQQQPGWLQSGMWSYSGNQVSPLSAGYEPSSGMYVVSDPYIINEVTKQKDFGRLFEIGKELQKVSSLVKGGVNSVLTKSAVDLISRMRDESIETIGNTLSDAIVKSKTELAQVASEKVASVKTVQATKEWGTHYDNRIKEYKTTVDGLGRKRDTWFRWLIFITCAYAIFAALIATSVIPLGQISSLQGIGKYFLGVTIYGLLGVVYVGYAFVVKQLKVHQNLLEQYRHRSVVAKTVESIVVAVIKTRDNTIEPGQESHLRDEDLKTLVQVAAGAMFEYRPIGHLSTKEGNGGILGEIIGSRNN